MADRLDELARRYSLDPADLAAIRAAVAAELESRARVDSLTHQVHHQAIAEVIEELPAVIAFVRQEIAERETRRKESHDFYLDMRKRGALVIAGMILTLLALGAHSVLSNWLHAGPTVPPPPKFP